jgi:streptogramin lyase
MAHQWVTGEVAGSCTDANNNVYTFNRGWQLGTTAAINGNDSYPFSARPSPPVVAYDPDGNVFGAWGNPSLNATTSRSTYLPNGAHGCFVDYQGMVWLAGNGDGIVQKYNPSTAAAQGAHATFVAQIGTKDVCDGPCGETASTNTSTSLLNEPADIAVDATNGDVYIADGYGNHRVVVFSTTNGVNYTFKRQFGTKCAVAGQCGPAEFGAAGGGHPHCVVLGNDDLVYACDRPNSRILVFNKMGGPVRQIPISNFPSATAPKLAAILAATNRACDIDFYPNVDYLANLSPTSQKYIVDVDLNNNNSWLLDKASGAAVGAFGRCGFGPCPGHNAGHFAYGHMTNVDGNGNVYISETITGRRIQRFVPDDQGPNEQGN